MSRAAHTPGKRPAPLARLTPGRVSGQILLAALVALWTVPTLGLLVSSFRDKDQLVVSGWWTALTRTERREQGRTGTDGVMQDGRFVIAGTVFAATESGRTVQSFGISQRDSGAWPAGASVDLPDGSRFTLNADGRYRLESDRPLDRQRGQRFFYVVSIPPTFTLANYLEVLSSEGLGQSFTNTLAVTIPATFIPVLIAAFAAYAFAWMRFPMRQWLFVLVVALLVVPLQMSLIPLLRMYNGLGAWLGIPAKSYAGIWLAHTGFGLPMAIYLLRNHIGSLPGELIESARVDGATHFHVFTRLVLPLSAPALASFAIFQFLWVWNDLLVALVFLGKRPDQMVMTSKLQELLGSRGDNWEILTSSAFISIIVPLAVFFALQRYFARGLLAGSVKG